VVPDLSRFVEAQNRPHVGLREALDEISGTGKRGHWIWYVFPQIAGLGDSNMSRTYAIADVEEGEAYLRDPILRPRLLAAIAAVAAQVSRGQRVDVVMGSSIDTQKLVSSVTLFRHLAARLERTENLEHCHELVEAADIVLRAAVLEGYPPCRHTLDRLETSGYRDE
jgi:uncharacterized protein (DUF1810 family)